MANVPITTVRDDLALIVGGSFTPDALGEARFNEVRARVAGEPKRYLNVLVATYFGGTFDAVALSHLRLATAVKLAAEFDPEAARGTAALIRRHIDGLLVIFDQAADRARLSALLPDATVAMYQRLDRQRQQLAEIIPRENGR